MDASEIKEYIINNDKLYEILEEIGCFKIKNYTKEYRCGSPKHEDATSIAVKKDSLKVKTYSDNEDRRVKGDLITLIMYIKDLTFKESLIEIHKILGLRYTGCLPKKQEVAKKDILEIFKKASKKTYEYKEELQIYNESICKDFLQIPYIEWIREGIMPSTQRIFNIGYSIDKDRVTIPHRYWCGSKEDYVGVIGRTLNPNYKELEIPKYFPLKAFPKSMNIYGLQENYKYIQEAGYVNVFESEKSTLKRHSLLDKTCVSLGGHEISDEQAKILISLGVDIIIIMDKDVKLDHIRSLCEKFYRIRKVYYVYDTFGLLGEKESPADKTNKVYNVMWNRKVEYDKSEHEKYIEYLKTQKD